jgi:hypothetical protein
MSEKRFIPSCRQRGNLSCFASVRSAQHLGDSSLGSQCHDRRQLGISVR